MVGPGCSCCGDYTLHAPHSMGIKATIKAACPDRNDSIHHPCITRGEEQFGKRHAHITAAAAAGCRLSTSYMMLWQAPTGSQAKRDPRALCSLAATCGKSSCERHGISSLRRHDAVILCGQDQRAHPHNGRAFWAGSASLAENASARAAMWAFRL